MCCSCSCAILLVSAWDSLLLLIVLRNLVKGVVLSIFLVLFPLSVLCQSCFHLPFSLLLCFLVTAEEFISSGFLRYGGRCSLSEVWLSAAFLASLSESGTLLVQYSTRDQVWLDGKNYHLPYQSTKLVPKRYRPFKIIKEISPVAYQLSLPLTWKIHNMFHAPLLSPYHETTAYGPNFSWPPPDLINDKEQYKVEQIHNH